MIHYCNLLNCFPCSYSSNFILAIKGVAMLLLSLFLFYIAKSKEKIIDFVIVGRDLTINKKCRKIGNERTNPINERKWININYRDQYITVIWKEK